MMDIARRGELWSMACGMDAVEAFALAVRREALEEAARLCDRIEGKIGGDPGDSDRLVCRELADRIRALIDAPPER